tara:strand:+ start:310 stop:528 length:219 start_codon:yes stop_codon:yes gene_type:complete
MLNKIYIQLSVFGLVYLAILFVTMVVTFIPITIWWLVTGYMISNILFLKICGIATTTIFVVSSLIGMISYKK